MPPTQLHHPSPKRKRDPPPLAPLLTTALAPVPLPPRGSPPPVSGADSPRNAVAAQLQNMTLVPDGAIPMSPLSPTDDVAHKKPKLDEARVDSVICLDQHRGPSQAAPLVWRHGDKLDPSREIPETPQAAQPRTWPDIAALAQPIVFKSSLDSTGLQQTISTSYKPRTQSRSSSEPRLRNKSPSPPLSTLTWKDSEITGHLAGPSTDPDDDGTGLNGIGFKPTPAIAYARAQRRRQQLNEWKARETREARAKRSERRRRGVGGAASREATLDREISLKDVVTTKRTVKFAV